ncbi:hypothetical protein BD413DRAFT_606182 [Trametes elegans]|nr:hypothetical protein BD413DRAFT_606182 [Trametes elegans]
MAANILVPNAHLVGLWLQMLATGAYFVYLPHSISILRKKLQQGLSIWLPAACALMFVVTVMEFIVEMIRGYEAFSMKGPKEPPNPALFYANPATTASLVKNALNIIVAVTSDAIMVYRTFVIWQMNWLVVLIPIGAVLANTAIGIWAMWTLSRTEIGDAPVLAEVTVRIRVFFIITFCVNVVCASLISLKIWRMHRLARHVSDGSSTRNVLEIVIESAAVYCAYLFVLIVSSSVGSNVFFIFLDPAVVFSMLIVRAQTGPAKGASTAPRSSIHFYTRSYGPGVTTGAPMTEFDETESRRPLERVELDLERVAGSVTDAPTAAGSSVSGLSTFHSGSGSGSGSIADKDRKHPALDSV